jgi:hypothetical protein
MGERSPNMIDSWVTSSRVPGGCHHIVKFKESYSGVFVKLCFGMPEAPNPETSKGH